MDRRAFLSALALGALGGCAAAPPETLSWHPRRTLAPLSEDPTSSPPNIPIVDFHTHLQRRVTAERLAQLQDQARVSRMVLMPLYYGDRPGFSINDGEGSDEQAAEYARRYPDRFMPFVGMQRSELGNAAVWGGRTPNGALLLRETEAKLRSGEFFGMGEFMLRFYPQIS